MTFPAKTFKAMKREAQDRNRWQETLINWPFCRWQSFYVR